MGPATNPRVLREAALVAVALFVVYALGACRSIYVGDSGELVAASHLLGVPHPTGYPLYVMAGKLWSLLVPVGSVAFRMSLFSAAAAALACAGLYALLRRARLGAVAALVAAGLLAFAPSFWSQANVQRVYALNALFVVAATAAAWRWHETRSPRAFVAVAFLCGLGAANHTFMGFYALAFGVFAPASEPGLLRRPGLIAAAACATVGGLLPYLYLPLRSRADPRLDWGDPETLDAFLGVVLRRGFWERRWLEGPEDVLVVAADWLLSLGSELAWVGTALAVIGIAAGRRRGWPVGLPVAVMLANVAALALHGSRSDIFLWHRYYVPSYAMAALLAGLGCQWLVERVPPGLRALRVAPLLLPAALGVLGWSAHDRSRFRVAEAFSEQVLASLPPGAHLAASDDNVLFSLIYLHFVEGRRPDVNLILQGVGDADLPPLRFDPDSDPIFFTHHPNWRVEGLEMVPVGLVFRAWRTGSAPPPVVLPEGPLEGADDPRVPKDYLTRNLIGQYHYMRGLTLETTDWLTARRELETAAEAAPDNDVLFYNLGLIYRRNGLLDEALAAFERSHAINPRHVASAGRVRASERLPELAKEQRELEAVETTLSGSPQLAGHLRRSAAWHEALARLLEQRGELRWARGHRLRALERAAAE